MTPLRKLRKLVQSRDIDSCRQGVELAAALGGDELPQLLARSGVRVAPSSDLLIGRAAKFLKRSLPQRVPQVVPGVGTRGAPAAVRAWVTLALAARSECRSARRLRKTTSLALTGQTDVREHMSIDVSVLERFSELDSLWLLDATRLEGESALCDLPLQRLVLSNVGAFDLSEAVMPDLESLELQCFLPLTADSDRIGPSFRTLTSLRHLSLLLNAHIAAELDALAQPTLETLIIRPTKLRDLTPLAKCTRLHHLELTNSHVDDLSPVSSSLGVLNLSGTSSRIDLRQLVRFEHLQTLDLRHVPITDWSPLTELPALTQLIVTSAVARELPPALQAKCRMNDDVF